MQWIIDRFEGDIALCEREDGGLEQIPLAELPDRAREGSVLVKGGGGAWALDLETERERRARLFKTQEGLFQ